MCVSWRRNPLFIKSEFSRGSLNMNIMYIYDRRNPLFIKSEFSLGSFYLRREHEDNRRNPLFIKSEFSQQERRWERRIGGRCRNPLFIKSEFSLKEGENMEEKKKRTYVAILYSSSQNSLTWVVEVENWGINDVAILYSSSQNSLGTSAIPCPAWAKI